jgi:hypothetical protein
MTPPLIIAQLLDEQCNLVDSFSFRCPSALAGWVSRAGIRPGDRINFKEGGRARVSADLFTISDSLEDHHARRV